MVLLRRRATFLMKQLLRRYAGYKIVWRKIFFAGAMMTAAGVMLQLFTLPFPLNMFVSQHEIVTSDELLKNMRLSESVAESAPNIFLNSPTELSNLSVPVQSAERLPVSKVRKSESRKKRKSVKEDTKLNFLGHPPPPPSPRRTVPMRLQVQLRTLFSCFPREVW